MCLQIDTDDPATFCQQRQNLSEHLDSPHAAVQQDQWLAFAVNLVLHLEAIDPCVIASGFVVHFISVPYFMTRKVMWVTSGSAINPILSSSICSVPR